MAAVNRPKGLVWDVRKTARERGVTFRGFGSGSDNAGGKAYNARFTVAQTVNGVTETVDVDSLRLRVTGVKAFGLQKSNFADKFSMGFVIDDAALMNQIFDGVRGGVLAAFDQVMPAKTGTILGRLDDAFRVRYGKAKGEARDKLAREAFAALDTDMRARFDAEADRELDDIMRFTNQKDGKGGFVSGSDKNLGEFIVNAEAYAKRGAKGVKGTQYYDAACENPKLELDVFVNGKKLSPHETWGAVCKDSPLGKNTVYSAQAMLLQLKNVHFKSDGSSISLGWAVKGIYKQTEEEEELDLLADEPAYKKTKLDVNGDAPRLSPGAELEPAPEDEPPHSPGGAEETDVYDDRV